MIDLIPSCWIAKEENNTSRCQYPGSRDYSKIPQWVTQRKEAEKDWEYFSIEIIAYAHNLKQGKRRLRRTFATAEVRSTDQGEKENVMPTLLSESDVQEELDNVQYLHADPLFCDMDKLLTPARSETETEGDRSEEENQQTRKKRKTTYGVLQEKVDRLEEKLDVILRAINCAKRSIQYDIDRKLDALKNTITINRLEHAGSRNIDEIRTSLETTFPITNMQDFLQFEAAIADSANKKTALIHLFRLLICGETCLRNSVKKLMVATISKEVQAEYTAFGRHINGIGKKDFSKTHTFSCIKDILIEKGGAPDEMKRLSTIFSRWFSGVGDRDGGRKQRQSLATNT
ncbi:uncharacterized protein LOC116853344 [Odontomachus brunneus]|uniref:uncharacterized protein LOC116853344 n=1 Tax=Odontomachus brunneus TaxID=486640 RepID=UPI0013F2A452|nr:uncharacterized protein LOC116853344 [Odontomachus brunneus]